MTKFTIKHPETGERISGKHAEIGPDGMVQWWSERVVELTGGLRGIGDWSHIDDLRAMGYEAEAV